MTELNDFLNNWGEDSAEAKAMFEELYNYAQSLGLSLQYIGRPGVSHSLRLGVGGNEERPFFAMIDIIDDDPEERWLSICMYADVADDPEEKGDWIPKGLNNQDAICFDIDETSEEITAYMKEVLKNAAEKSKK